MNKTNTKKNNNQQCRIQASFWSKARNFRKDAVHTPKKVCQKSQIWRTSTEATSGRQVDDNLQIPARISNDGVHRI